MKNNYTKGFTLIEVLIVVSIIGLLTSATLLGLGGFRQTGRDARRISDVRQIQNALELFYAKNSVYPNALSDIVTAGIGISSLPKDPNTGNDYEYSKTNCPAGVSYALRAVFEDANNRALSEQGTVCNLDCSKAAKGYCITF